jgi:hypothetical protein
VFCANKYISLAPVASYIIAMRAASALLVLLAVAAAAATQMCLSGEAALVPGVSAPAEPWCSADDCTLRWRLSFDTATVGNQRWPLEATINGTALTSLWPALTDVGIQCSTSGELIATTASGSGGERLRLVWTYAGVSSFSCTYMLGAVDTASDFRNFQALLAYSGHIASFDATFSSQAPDYSLAAASVVCPAAPSTSTGSGPAPSAAPACIIGGCRYTPVQWRAHKTSPVWQAVTGRQFCSISYSDIIFVRGQAKYMPVHWLQEAQLLVAADMDAALYGCALPIDTNAAAAASYAFISNSLNCALNIDRPDVVAALAEWTDGSAACINDNGVTTGTVHKSSTTSKEQSYLIWAIVMTIAFALACFALAAIMVLMARPLLAMLSGNSDSAAAASSSRTQSVMAGIGGRLTTFFFDTDEYDAEAPLAPASATPALVAAEHVPTTPMVVTTKPQPAASYASPYPAYASGGGATYAPPAAVPFVYY